VSALLAKRSVIIAGHRTSVSLEPVFWRTLKEIAAQRGLSLNALVAEIDKDRTGNLSSALRVFVVEHLSAAAQTKASSRSSSADSE